jgi:hypothetical protein
MSDITTLSATEIAAAVRGGTLSAAASWHGLQQSTRRLAHFYLSLPMLHVPQRLKSMQKLQQVSTRASSLAYQSRLRTIYVHAALRRRVQARSSMALFLPTTRQSSRGYKMLEPLF